MTSSRSGLPNLIIAGVHKAGTTALYSYLAKHPEICASFKKETNYFVPLAYGSETRPIEEYARNFNHCGGERFRMEASPSYLYGREHIANRINTECGDARIIMILRDPVDRLMSFFNRAVASSVLPEDITFSEYVRLSVAQQDNSQHDVYSRGVREGRYIEYIPPWQDIFGQNLKIVFFDDLKEAPYRMTAELCKWLGLEHSCYAPEDFTVENRTIHYRFRGLHRLVHDGYMRSERFWRKNHRLKRQLRRVYNLFNADSAQKAPTIDEETLSSLRAIYEPCNRGLKSFLSTHDYKSLPEWLN